MGAFSCYLDNIISIHALLAESDVSFMLYDTSSLIFLSTLSLRRATGFGLARMASHAYFYPRSPCGERPINCMIPTQKFCISIHALLAESDAPRSRNYSMGRHISIHALLAESDQNRPRPSTGINDFYPRSPCGERPCTTTITICIASFLSTLSLRRATTIEKTTNDNGTISIHALLAESDIFCQTCT